MRSALCKRFAIALAISTLAACGGGGGGGGGPPASATLSASATDVPRDGIVTLTWSSTNASACTASGGWSGALAASGSRTFPVPNSGTFTLTCGTATSSVTVTAWKGPTVTLTADTTTLLPNNSAQLTWGSANATTCVGGGGLPATIATSGSQPTAVLTTTTSYSIACSNPAYPSAANAALTITVDSLLTLTVAVQYQAPGPPVANPAGTALVPDWAHPLASPVPLVYVELDDANGKLLQSTFADAAGVATFTGLSPGTSYTPKVESRIQYAPLALDFAVLNNSAPLDTSQTTFRGRYGPYVTVGPAYTPSGKAATQSVSVTLPDGWNAATGTLVDANRVAGPYELLAFAVLEAQTVSAAVGGTPAWKPLTILWSVKNKGGLAAPPNNFDQGIVTGVGAYYQGTHVPIDASGTDGSGATPVSEAFIYLSGDQTQEAMEIYPFLMMHEMGHFAQAQFSTIVTPNGDHAYSDYEDALLAWIEGSASGIAALVMGTPEERRLQAISGGLVANVYDLSKNTLNGNPQAWPVGWYQESTTTNLLWSVYDPGGGIGLSTQATLAPMFSSTWTTAPWLNTVWAYVSLLTDENSAAAAAVNSWSEAHGITAAGNDVWGSTETHVPADRSAQDVLPPYVTVPIGQPVSVCSAGAPLEYNKAGNTRQLRLLGDGAMRTLTVTGPAGTVPVLGNQFMPGAASTSLNGAVMANAVTGVGDCAVAYSESASGEAACMENGVPPAETCWSVTLQ